MCGRNKLLALLLAGLVVLTGCTSFRPVDLPTERLREEIALGNIVRPGDKVKILLTNGEEKSGVVSAVTDTTLEFSDGKIPISDIVSIQARVPDDEETMFAILGGSALLTLVLVVALSSLAFFPAY